jgi:DNA-binding PadR family transcriptional regulator
MTETLTLYKLIILYMLDKVDFPLSNAQLSEFILEKEYTDYFTVQQAISELLETGFVRMETSRNTSLYHITEAGRETLAYFHKKISSAIQEDIDHFLEEHKYQLRNALSTPADYYKTTDGEYAARCRVLEKNAVLIDLTLTVPTQEQAAAICSHWRDKSQELYASIIQTLL